LGIEEEENLYHLHLLLKTINNVKNSNIPNYCVPGLERSTNLFCASAFKIRAFTARAAHRKGCQMQQQQCDHNQIGSPHINRPVKGAKRNIF